MTFPLGTFPTIPDSLDSTELSVHCINTFMKNTLIRGLNVVYEAAQVISPAQDAFLPFLEYTLGVCEMLSLHLRGDERFFTLPNGQGKRLVDFLGPDCNPNEKKLWDAIMQLQCSVIEWTETPESYVAADMLRSLDCLGNEMLQSMQKQLDAMDHRLMRNAVKEEELRDMIQENLAWLSANSDMSFLLPFVLFHHDPSTSVCWPAVTPEGLKVMPDLVKEHAACWQFAPFKFGDNILA